jgi:hypothetical protein
MFQKLAKVRSFELWLTMPQRKAVHHPELVPSNDNRPRRDGRIPHPRHSPARRLACRWSLSRDGRLTCRWDVEADDPCGGQPSAPAADRPGLAGRNPINLRKATAG